MVKVILFAAALVAAGADGAEIVRAGTVAPTCRIAYDVSFPAEKPGEETVAVPLNRCVVHWSETADAPESRWRRFDVDVGFTGFTRILGSVGKGFHGIPWPHKGDFPMPAVRPDEVRKVEIVYKDGYLSVYLENDGRLRLFCRRNVPAGIFIRGVSFPRKGRVANVTFASAADAPDPTPRVLEVPRPAEGRIARFTLRPGLYPSFSQLDFREAGTNRLTLVLSRLAQDVGATRVYDSGLRLFCGKTALADVYSYPKIAGRYEARQYPEMLANLDRYGSKAGDHDFLCEIRRGPTGWGLWMEGSFVAALPVGERFEGVCASVASGGRLERLPDLAEASDPLRLDLTDVKPFDTSFCKVNLAQYEVECNGYLSRMPNERLPDSFIRRVPTATYTAAIVRCRVDGAETNTCELTARLTRCNTLGNQGRSPYAMSVKTVTLPKTNGVYTVRLDLDPGLVRDFVYAPEGVLDLELLGGISQTEELKVKPRWRPSERPSGVTVLGAALVRAPAGLRMDNGAYGNVFVAGERVSVTTEVAAAVAGDYAVEWRVTDIDGKTVETGRRDRTLAEGAVDSFVLDFRTGDVGWYALELSLLEGSGRTLVRIPASFAIIAPDTRKAGYESPYFTWSSIGKADTNEFRRMGAFLKRVGIRRTQLGKYTEEDAAAFGLTLGSCYHCKWKRDGTPEEMRSSFEREARLAMAKWPHISNVLIYHEHKGGPPPQELAGGTTVLTEKDLAHQLDTVEGAIWRGEIWRKVAPQATIQIGNSGNSLSLMGEVLRGGVPKHLFDTIGEESTGEAVTPERSCGWSFRNLKDLAEIYGYTNRVMACYEWKTRVPRLFFGNLRKHAAWRMRDSLIALVWGSETIDIESGGENATGYATTCWGAGAFTRAPLLQPYPLLAAIANLTRVMDRCTFSRLVPTGSKSVYLVEFRNPEGTYVYAGWTARGELEATFGTKASRVLVTDLFGREGRASPRTFKTKLSEEPVYFTMDGPVVSADATGARTYPWEAYPTLGRPQVLAKMDDVRDWSLEETNELACLVAARDEVANTRPGRFGLSAGEDGSLAVTLKREGDVKPIFYEYGFVRPRKPVEIPSEATTIGVDVKGNSGWGKVFFILEGANGVQWISAGRGFAHTDHSDTRTINFDGWHRLRIMIREESPVKCASIEPNMRQWRLFKTHRGSKNRLTYPMKLVAVGFALRRKTFDLVDWVDPDTDTVLFRNFGVN